MKRAPVRKCGRARIDRDALAAKASELDETIRKLGAMRDGLRHAAVCPAPSHLECPTFRRLLSGAAARAGEEKKKSAPERRGASKPLPKRQR